MLFANLLQGALSPPRSSCREEFTMPPSRRQTNIHSLPVELLTYIFVLGSSLDYPYANSPFLLKPDLGSVPLPSSNFQVVAHVCKHWRQVSLRTQSLWTTIHIRENIHIPRAIAYLSRCRTSTYLLDILIDTVAVDEYTAGITLYKDELAAIFEIIVPFVGRWRSFHLKICDNECKGIARQFLSSCGPGPNLETLQLYHFEDFRTTQRLFLATHRPPVTIFDNDLPCLKNVSLIGVNLLWDKSLYLSNLHHLELALHLDNVRPPYRWWERMLRSSPELKSLTLHYSGPKESTGVPELAWSSANDKVQLPQLKELCFIDLDPDYLLNLVERLQVPNLKKLTLDLREQDFTPFIEFLTAPPEHPHPASSSPSTLVALPKREFPELPVHVLGRLETLIIRGLDCSLRSWAALLRAMHNLRVLEVVFTRTSSGFWKMFTHEGDALNPPASQGERHARNQSGLHQCGRRSPALFPRLEAFKLSGVSGKDILSALYCRHRCAGLCPPRLSEKWIVRWSERRRGKDPELDALVDKGHWAHKDGESTTEVIIETFSDDDEEDIEDADDETPSTSDDEGDSDKDS